MEISNLFFYGITGYLLLCIYDYAQYREKRLLRIVFSIGFPLTAVPYILLLTDFSHAARFPFPWNMPFFLLLVLLSLLLLYSALLEIPIHRYRQGNHPSSRGKPIIFTDGTYSFSRHPGFIWYTLINVIFMIYYWNMSVIALMISLTLGNLLLITVEDRYIFPRTFEGYDSYKKRVGFIFSYKRAH